MTSVQPPVHFGEMMYVDDTEYDDILSDELAEKNRMMVLLQAIECDEYININIIYTIGKPI